MTTVNDSDIAALRSAVLFSPVGTTVTLSDGRSWVIRPFDSDKTVSMSVAGPDDWIFFVSASSVTELFCLYPPAKMARASLHVTYGDMHSHIRGNPTVGQAMIASWRRFDWLKAIDQRHVVFDRPPLTPDQIFERIDRCSTKMIE